MVTVRAIQPVLGLAVGDEVDVEVSGAVGKQIANGNLIIITGQVEADDDAEMADTREVDAHEDD